MMRGQVKVKYKLWYRLFLGNEIGTDSELFIGKRMNKIYIIFQLSFFGVFSHQQSQFNFTKQKSNLQIKKPIPSPPTP